MSPRLLSFIRAGCVLLALVLLAQRLSTVAAFTNGQAASLVLGHPDFTSSAPPPIASAMNHPTGVAADPTSGKLFIADSGNHRVLRFASGAALVSGAAADGVFGQPDFTSNAPATTASGMADLSNLTVDSAGRLWVADHGNNRVLRFDGAASKLNGAAADGVLGQSDFTSNFPATTASGMYLPYGVAVDDAGRLWVADYVNRRVLRFDGAAGKANGAAAEGVLGQLNFTSSAPATTASGMSDPAGVAVDSAGRLWVGDANNNRVLRFDGAATKVNGAAANGVLGQPDFTSSAFATTANAMIFPVGVAVDSADRLWVADTDNNRVLRLDGAAGKANGAAADGVLGQRDFTSNAPATTARGMNHPTGVAVDPTSGKLFVADSGNHRVLRFASGAALVSGAAAEGVLGQSDFISKVPATTASGMYSPSGVAVDSAGRLWVTDTFNHRVLRFDGAAGKANGARADGVLGQSDFISKVPATTASGMYSPSGVAVDSVGRLWVADTFNRRVLCFDGAADKANGAAANGVLGQSDFTSSAFATTTSGMRSPTGVAVDSADRLWVADQSNSRVLRFDEAAGKANGANADGVLGQRDFTSDAQATTASAMIFPAGVAVDSAGRLWVVDELNYRALRFDNAAGKANGVVANGVLGQRDFTSNAPAITATGMNLPSGLAVDSADNLWVADQNNNRVLRFDGPIVPTITWANPAAITYGTALGAAQLNASASVPGSFSYTPPLGTVLNAGAGQTLSVLFMPTDSANYNPVTKTVTIDVIARLYLPPITR